MTVENIIKGLQIIEKHRPENESPYHLRAEHDEIFVGSVEWPIPPEDLATLEELGWEADEDIDGFRTTV